jgi:hypothetical protein
MRRHLTLFRLPNVAAASGNGREQSFGLNQRAMSIPAFKRAPFFGTTTSNSAENFTSNSVENDICLKIILRDCLLDILRGCNPANRRAVLGAMTL